MDLKQNKQLNQDIEYQDYIETKRKVDDVIKKLGLENRKHFKFWLNMQQMRIFEIEQYENSHK